jgi:hypothetical protein
VADNAITARIGTTMSGDPSPLSTLPGVSESAPKVAVDVPARSTEDLATKLGA